jgi:hypothetical protein
MDGYRYCSQALLFPQSQVPPLLRYFLKRRLDLAIREICRPQSTGALGVDSRRIPAHRLEELEVDR